MREEEFRDWLETYRQQNGEPLKQSSKNAYVTDNKRVEDEDGFNLDTEFKKDEMASLLERYTYSLEDKRNERGNPTNLDIELPALYKSLGNHKVVLNHYRRFCLSVGDDVIYEARENNNDSDTNANATFGLEKDLQAALRKHIDQLEVGLRVIDGGSERSVDSGRIDILAKDSNGAFVIIELKAGTATDSVVAQILGYMGDIAEEENAEVRGIIVAADFNKRVQSASRATSNLELKTYRYNFEFN